MTEARPIASSPTRLSRNPPPITMRSVSRQPLSLRKRRMTRASSCAKSSIAPRTMPAASGSPSASRPSSCLLADLVARLVAERILAGLAQRLAPVLDDSAECVLAGAVADEAFIVARRHVVAVDLDRRQALRAMGRERRCHSRLFRHGIPAISALPTTGKQRKSFSGPRSAAPRARARAPGRRQTASPPRTTISAPAGPTASAAAGRAATSGSARGRDRR